MAKVLNISRYICLITLTLVLSGQSAKAQLNDSLSNNQKLAQRFGAIQPTYEVNSQKKVYRVHYEAPASMWSMKTADAIRLVLVGNKRKLEKKYSSGAEMRFVYTDGVKVTYLTFNGQVVNITAYTKEYKEPDIDELLKQLRKNKKQ